MKYQYRIEVNKGCKTKQPIIYNYGATKDIQLRLCKNNATVSFEMNVRKTLSDFSEMKVNLFIDAYRKISLLHSIMYGEAIKIKRISIFIDKEEHDLPVERIRLFSMLSESKLTLTEQWKTYDFLTVIANASKDSIQHDRRFCSIFALLTSQCREYEIDRFINLWTAINAYYGYIADLVKQRIEQDSSISNNKRKDMLREIRKDGTQISFLMQLIHKGANHKGFNKDERVFHDLERELNQINIEDVAQLYEETFSVMNDIKSINVDKFSKLYELANEKELPLYLILLLEMPYHLRCRYVHGNNPMLMLTYENDIELNTLRVVNYFLTRFLNDNIPSMFEDDFLDDSKYEVILSYVKP